MPKCVIYEDDGSVYAEWSAEMIVACGFTPPGYIHAAQNIEIEGSKAEHFACKLHLSAQLQVAARDLLRQALLLIPGQPTELTPELEKEYIDCITEIEREMQKEAAHES